jgi:hypothetical protein
VVTDHNAKAAILFDHFEALIGKKQDRTLRGCLFGLFQTFH